LSGEITRDHVQEDATRLLKLIDEVALRNMLLNTLLDEALHVMQVTQNYMGLDYTQTPEASQTIRDKLVTTIKKLEKAVKK